MFAINRRGARHLETLVPWSCGCPAWSGPGGTEARHRGQRVRAVLMHRRPSPRFPHSRPRSSDGAELQLIGRSWFCSAFLRCALHPPAVPVGAAARTCMHAEHLFYQLAAGSVMGPCTCLGAHVLSSSGASTTDKPS